MTEEHGLTESALWSPTTWPGFDGLYARLRSYFRENEKAHDELRRELMMAHMPITYDDYLARSAIYAFVAGLGGALIETVIVLLLLAFGISLEIPSLVSLGQVVSPAVISSLKPYLLFIETVVGEAVGAALITYAVWQVRLRLPGMRATERKRKIHVTLPHAIVFLYALTSGGMNVVEAMRALADSDDVYGETAVEFRRIVDDMGTFGTDLPSALRNAREATPSSAFEQFLDDMLTIIDTGGDLTSFFDTESSRYLTDARSEQQDLIDFLALIAEMYITLLVAGPLFLIILLLVIGLLGGSTITPVFVIIYAGVPLLSLMILVLLDVIAQPFSQTNWRISGGHETPPVEVDTESERAKRYTRRKRWKRLLARVRHPVQLVSRTPALSLVVTVPAAILLVVQLHATGHLTVSYQGLLASPVVATTQLLILPFYVVAVPYVVLYERKRKFQRQMEKRFPSVLKMIANANEIGLTLGESLSVVAERDHSVLAPGLRRVRNDIEWNGDVEAAMVGLANRARLPTISRTIRLLIEANRSSSDLSRVLKTAAEDASSQERLKQERFSEISAYVAVVVITFLVFLGIIAMLDVFFLDTFAAQPQQPPAPGELGQPSSFSGLAVDEFRMAFFHASLVQGLFGGLLAGKMSHNEVAPGLKYCLAFVTLALGVFLVL